MSEVHRWVKDVGLLDKVIVQIMDYLDELGATDLEDLAGLTGEHVRYLLELVPPLKLDKFKDQLALYCPVLLHTFLFSFFFLYRVFAR